MQIVITTDDDGETTIEINKGEHAGRPGREEPTEPASPDRFDRTTATDAGPPPKGMLEPDGEGPGGTESPGGGRTRGTGQMRSGGAFGDPETR